MIRRLFPYYGAKHRTSSVYPAPRHGRIVEPFAGSAAYSHRYGEELEVVLVEKNPRVAAIWRWLLTVSEDEFMSLPGLDTFDHIDETGLPEGPAREFVRQWCSVATPSGRNTVSSAVKFNISKDWSAFTESKKSRFFDDIRKIRHWEIVEGDFSDAPDIVATWYIDPPYQIGGEHYRWTGADVGVDFEFLSRWSRSRRGDVIVCEGDGAEWMDFDPLKSCTDHTSHDRGLGTKNRVELIWYARDGVKIEGWNVGSFASPGQESLF